MLILNSDPGDNQHQGYIDSFILPQQRAATEGPAESQETTLLCSRCKRLTTQDRELNLNGVSDICEKCGKNSELAYVTQAASSACVSLTNLAEKLRSGISSEHRSIIRVS
jgi:hypothetical protein